MKNGLSYSISGIPSSDRPGAASHASSDSVSGSLLGVGRAWLVVGTGSSGVSPSVAGMSTSIAAGGVGVGGGGVAASEVVVDAGCLASLCCWLASRFQVFRFSISCRNLRLFLATCASVLTFATGPVVTLDGPGTGAGPLGVWGPGAPAFWAAWCCCGFAGGCCGGRVRVVVAVAVAGRGVELFRLLLAVVDGCGRSRRSMSVVRSAQPRL